MIKKNISTFTAMFFFLVVGSTVQAFSTTKGSNTNPKMGVVDMQVVETKAEAIIDLSNKLKAEQIKLRESINAKSKNLQKKARELETKKGVYSIAKIEEERKALESELILLQSDAQVRNENIQVAKGGALMEIETSIRSSVQKVAGSQGLQLVIPKQSALYVHDDIANDITDRVVKELNSTTKHIDIAKHISAAERGHNVTVDSKGKK